MRRKSVKKSEEKRKACEKRRNEERAFQEKGEG